MLLLTTLKQASSSFEVVILLCFLGTGLSLFQLPNNARVMSSVPADKLGIASSTNALFRYIGLSSGITFSMLIFSLSSNINVGNLSGGFHVSAFLHGIAVVYLFDAVCALIAMAFSMPKRKQQQNKESFRIRLYGLLTGLLFLPLFIPNEKANPTKDRTVAARKAICSPLI